MKLSHLILACSSAVLVAGCASATPIDFIWPTRMDNTTKEVLGADAPKASFVPWHTLSDTKAEKEVIDAKIQVWVAKGELAKENNSQIKKQNDPISIGIWGIITAILMACGIFVPRPQEGKKVTEALYKYPPE